MFGLLIQNHPFTNVSVPYKCEEPYPVAPAADKNEESSKAYISKTTYVLTYSLFRPSVNTEFPVTKDVVCQEEIEEPTYETVVWIPLGEATPITFLFTAVSSSINFQILFFRIVLFMSCLCN